MAEDAQALFTSDFIRTDVKLYFKFKEYTFYYCPKNVRMGAETRKGEYRYINTNGVEYTRLQDTLSITVSGVWVKEVTGAGVEATAMEQLRNLQLLDKDNTPGVLHLPRFGDWLVILDNWSVEEDGDYPGDYDFTLNFLTHVEVQQVERIESSLLTNQADLPASEQRNVIYTIKSGDTLSAIASTYGVSLVQLKAWNPDLFNASHRYGSLIHPGEVVTISKASSSTEPPYMGGTIDKTVKIKNNITEIPRDERLATFVENKGKVLLKNPPISALADIGSGVYNYYTSPKTGSNLPKVIQAVTDYAIGDYYREADTTVQKYYKEFKKKAAESGTEVAAAVGVAADKAYKLWEAFGDIIEYPGNRTEKVDTSKAVVMVDKDLA